MSLTFSATAVSAQGTVEEVLARYRPIVQRFAAGDENAAVVALGTWTESEVRREVRLLKTAAEKLRKCPGCPDRAAFARFPQRAAILLHARREILEQLVRPESEQPGKCGVGLQSHLVEQHIRILLLLDPDDGVFGRDVYLAMSRHAQWTHCGDAAVEWAAMGLKLFPNDATLHLAHGTALEAQAFFAAAPSPDTSGLSARLVVRRQELLAGYRRLWEVTLKAYQAAVDSDPRLPEARLRLGRVLWRLGKADEAASLLEGVLARDAAAEHTYLAHLFLGRVLEERGRLAEAESHYLEAMKRDPLSLTTSVALSHVRFLQGDVASARDLLVSGMEAVRTRVTYDPWITYELTQTPDGLTLLEDLRKRIWP